MNLAKNARYAKHANAQKQTMNNQSSEPISQIEVKQANERYVLEELIYFLSLEIQSGVKISGGNSGHDAVYAVAQK